MVKRVVFLTKPKQEYHLSHEENVFMVPNHEKKEIIMQIHVCPNRQTNINSKNERKSSFSFETKASIYLSRCGE